MSFAVLGFMRPSIGRAISWFREKCTEAAQPQQRRVDINRMTRKLEEDPTHKKPQHTGAMSVGETGSTGSSPAAAGGAQQAAPDTLWKRAPMRFKADYKEVPGSGKNKVKSRGGDDGLWLDLSVQSLAPDLDESSSSRGLVAGSGAQLIDTFSAPMTDGPQSHGAGKLTARLHHADRFTSSLDVVVNLPDNAKEARARKAAIEFVKIAATKSGDVDQLQARTATHLAELGFPGADVRIKRIEKATHDLGESSFYYRVRGPSQVLMDIQAADAGQSEPTKYEVSKDKADSSENESERHHEHSKDETTVSDSKRATERHHEHSEESTDVQYNKRVVETLVEIVGQVEHLRSDFVEHVTNDLTKHSKFNELKRSEKNWGERTIGHSGSSKTGHKEAGEKDRRNIANDIKDVTETIKDVVSLPYLEDLKFIRRLQPWWLLVEGIDLVAGKFKAKGKVNVEDSKEKSTADHNESTHGHAKETHVHNGSRTDTEKHRGNIRRTVDQASQSLWSNFKRRVETTTETYRSRSAKNSSGGADSAQHEAYESKNEKAAAGGSERKKEQQRSGTTVTISASTITKYTKPVVKPTVVAGDCEVSTEPFSVEKKKGG